MQGAIAEPRDTLSEHAPRMESFKISVDKIGAVIGPGGKNVRALQEEHKVKIDIQEDGRSMSLAKLVPKCRRRSRRFAR